MNFNLNATTGAKEAGAVLSSGIHAAKFMGIVKDEVNASNGNVYSVMSMKLDVDGYGEYVHNFFEPTSKDRTSSQFGENPSQVEHFLIAVRQILDALDPKIGEGIDNGEVSISGTFTQIVNQIKTLTSPYIGKSVVIKLLPNNKGYAAIPGFPARVAKNGALGIGTKFIAAENLVLSDREKARIDAVKNATPTNMATKDASDLLDSMKDDDDFDDLPFN